MLQYALLALGLYFLIMLFLLLRQGVGHSLLLTRTGMFLLAIGVVLWALTWLTNRGIRAKKTGFRDPEALRE